MQKEDARKPSREVLHERLKQVIRMHRRARYIHVQDLAQGHVAALQSLSDKGESFTVNLGTGQGHSVLEVVRAFEQASGRPVPYQFAPRRAGDVAQCYADSSLAKRLLGWRATHTLSDMRADAWRWQSSNPKGYG